MKTLRPALQNYNGFTLLEVLVALAIVAVALSAIIKTTADLSANASYLRDKTFAHWVALNQMTELQLQKSTPAVGFSSGSEEMARTEWYWQTKVEETANKSIHRVEITVRLHKDDDLPGLVTLTGFIGN